MGALKKRLGEKEASFFEHDRPQESFVKEELLFYTRDMAGEKAKSEEQSYFSWMKEKFMMLLRKKEAEIPQICEKRSITALLPPCLHSPLDSAYIQTILPTVCSALFHTPVHSIDQFSRGPADWNFQRSFRTDMSAAAIK